MQTSRIWTGLGWVLAVGFFGAVTTRLGVARLVPQREDKEVQQEERKSERKIGLRELTPEEARVIEHKGTERPFTGEYNRHDAPGVYTCRRCEAALYRADDKFDAGCGWSSFDAEIPGAVRRVPDADGRRTEILCATCEGHLGHVFTGEHFTARNTRHCVNSLSMRFVAEADLAAVFERATFAGGCFWGVEYYFQKAAGVIHAVSGYTGGTVEKPSYEQVCSGKTGHYEVVDVLYDPRQTSYETLAKLFFEIHDPTQQNGQGADIGSQYLSAVFVHNDAQRTVAEGLIAQLREKGYDIATVILPAKLFYPAEAYHQNYYARKGGVPYCHSRTRRF